MSVQRMRLKDLEQSSNVGSMVATDSNGEGYYLAPGPVNNVLVIDASGIPFWSNVLTVTGINYRSSLCTGPTPSISFGTGAGTGASVTVAGTQEGGTVTLTTGSGALAANAVIFTISYLSSLPPNGSAVTLFPINGNAAQMALNIVAAGTRNGFSAVCTQTLNPNTTYQWNYLTSGY